jgi:SseB protein N-terminal domain
MGLFRRSAARQPGPQDAFADHLAAIARGQDGAIAGFVRALMAQEVWEAWRELPPGVEAGQTVTVEAAVHIRILSTTMPDGGAALAVFSSDAGVRARSPQAYPVKRPGADVLKPLIEGDPKWDGLVFDPAGPVYQVLRAQWVRDAVAGRL